MDNPQYTATQVNRQIAKQTSLPISIEWDGNDVAPGESAYFSIVFNEDETKYSVEDSGAQYEVNKDIGFRRYHATGWASGYYDLAKLIISIINEAVRDGELEPVEDAQ